MRFLKRLVLLLSLVLVCGCTPSLRSFERLNDDAYVKICVTNVSLDAFRLRYHRSLVLGSVYPGESVWIFLPYGAIQNYGISALLAHNVTGARDARPQRIFLEPSILYSWELSNSYINNEMSLKPIRGGPIKCDYP